MRVSSMFSQAWMPYKPCAALHTRKNTMKGAHSKSISAKDKNVSDQRIRDSLKGITAKMVIKSLIPNLKNSLKNILRVLSTGALPLPQNEANGPL